ncbi:MAG: hypothetical protein WCF74_12720 [Candidatus Sulfotelmatobacter sp.]
MATDRIKAAQLKVERAKKHISDFDLARVEFLSANPYAATPEYYVEHDATVWYLDRWECVPKRMLLPYGDAVHNLRSALDYLWWQLVEVCGVKPDPKKRPTFPIFKDLESFEKYVAEPSREVEAVLKRVEDALRRTHPYKGGNDTLWGLNELDYIDKHRFLIVAAISVSHFGVEVGGRALENLFPGNVRLSHPLPQRTAWFHPRTSEWLGRAQGDPVFTMKGNFEANQNIQLTFDIALTEPEVFKGKPLLETIFAASKVVENLLTDFEPFLL